MAGEVVASCGRSGASVDLDGGMNSALRRVLDNPGAPEGPLDLARQFHPEVGAAVMDVVGPVHATELFHLQASL